MICISKLVDNSVSVLAKRPLLWESVGGENILKNKKKLLFLKKKIALEWKINIVR